MTNLQAQTIVQTLMAQGNKALTAQAIAIGEITPWDNPMSNFDLAVLIANDTHDIWITGTNIQDMKLN